jgi:hypothetical protein
VTSEMDTKNTTKKMTKKSRKGGTGTTRKGSGSAKRVASSKRVTKSVDAGIDKRFVRRDSEAPAIRRANERLLRVWRTIYESRTVVKGRP